MIFECDICHDTTIWMHRIHWKRNDHSFKFVYSDCYENRCEKCFSCGKTFHQNRTERIWGGDDPREHAHICHECRVDAGDNISKCRRCNDMFFVDPSDEGVRRDICPKCQRNIRKCEICHQEFLPSTSLSRDMSTCDQCIRTETGGHLDYSSRSKLQKTIKIERERHLATIAIDPGSEL